MPGWHARTRQLEADGKLVVAGIVEEQHGDRAELFMQWKEMDWPIMVDPMNLLDVRAVPTTLLIDERGTIRSINPDDAALGTFLDTEYPADGQPQTQPPRADEAVAHFRRGVGLRSRYDSPQREPDDFAGAISEWSAALALDPGQYIWRRRIQQYGPRLDKPYSFYDWVPAARAAIIARGEEPVPLNVEPSGAEFATPGSDQPIPSPNLEHPDPDGKLPSDSLPLVAVQAVVVPSTDPRSLAYRVHLKFEPSVERRVHWNNEAGISQVRIDTPEGWQTDAAVRQLADPTRGTEAVSAGARHVEFELKPAGDAAPTPITSLPFAAFYFVCEDENGTCQFLKQELEIPFNE